MDQAGEVDGMTTTERGAAPPRTPPDQRRPHRWSLAGHEQHRWPALIAILVAMALYVTLPGRLFYGPGWLLPALEGALFLALFVSRQVEDTEYRWQRRVAIGLIATMNAANVGSLFLLIQALLRDTQIAGQKITADHLVIWAAQIWLTNVIVFALWYWELDRGGPLCRGNGSSRTPDFLFPQMVNTDTAPPGWTPSFFDYVYTSFTNAAAFSPADTMPLSEWAKALFMIQSLASLLTAVLVIARIANILP